MNSLRAVNNSYQGPLHGITDFDNNYNYVGTDPRLGGRVRPPIRMSGGIYDGAFQNPQLAENPMDKFDLMNDPRFPGARRTREFLRQTEQGVPLDKRNMGREIFTLPLAAVGADQQPAQGPFTPIRNYPGMGYGPYAPGGGGLPPAPVRQANNTGFYMGPQAGQADQYPPMAAGFLNKYVS